MGSNTFPKDHSNIAIGIDIVSISRIDQILQSHPRQFRKYAFTKNEQEYCDNQGYPSQHYASRWAVKEAYVKAIGAGDVSLSDIEVLHYNDVEISLHDSATERLAAFGEKRGKSVEDLDIDFSMTHSVETDTASAIVLVSALG